MERDKCVVHNVYLNVFLQIYVFVNIYCIDVFMYE